MTRLLALRRSLVGAAGAAVLTLTAAACDSSPVAASINGTEIKQTAVNRELRLQTANKTYVSAINRAAAANPGSVSVTGDAPQTLSTRYVAGVLSTMIQAEAVHQRVVSTGHLPGGPALAAARAVDEALFAGTWLAFPSAFRDSQVAQDAEHAQIEPPPSDLQTLRTAYDSVAKYFFAQVCTRTVAVSVRNGDGTVNQAASLGDANQISSAYNLGHSLPALRSTIGTPSGGDVACYDGASLEAQGQQLFDRVLALAPGQATAPQQTAFGYEVLAVDSRQPLPFDQAAQRALELGIAQAHGAADPALAAVVASAHVTVDPVYGRWDRNTIAVVPSSPLGANSSASS